MKKFGKLSTSASAPVPSGLFSASLFTDQMNRRSFDENLNPLAERVERNTFASLGKNTEDGSLKRRKVTKKKVSDLERSMRHGHAEDLEFLMTQTQQGATYNLDNQGFYKLGLLLPKEWKMERRDRCRAWLVHKLGFEEKLFGSDSAYIHNSIRSNEFNGAARQAINWQAEGAAAASLQSSTSQGSLNTLKPLSLSIDEVQTIGSDETSASRPGSNKRALAVTTGRLRPREKASDSEDSEDETSPRPSTFSPKSGGRSSRAAQSPFWGRGRSLTSPAEAALVTFNDLHIADEGEEQKVVGTRSRGNSTTNRSRQNSDSSTVDGSQSTKSRCGSAEFPFRCPSRAGATILEESKEEVDEELAQYHPPPAEGPALVHTSSAATMVSHCSAMDVLSGESGMIFPTLSTGPSPTPQAQRSSLTQQNLRSLPNGYGHPDQDGDGDDRDSDVATLRDEDEVDAEIPHAAHPMTPGDGASRSATSSPVHTIPAGTSQFVGQPAFVHPPRHPHDLRPGPVMYEALKGGDGASPGSLRRSVPEASRPTVLGRGQLPPDKPMRPGKTNRPSSRALGAQGRSHTTSAIYGSHLPHEASPGATIPSLGIVSAFAQPNGTFHTPVAMKPAGLVEDYLWEISEPVPADVLQKMKQEFRVASVRYELELTTKPRLQRAVSDPYAGSSFQNANHASPVDRRDSDFLRGGVGGFVGIGAMSFGGRDSIGSTSSAMRALVCDRPSLGGEEGEMNVCQGSPNLESLHQAVREHKGQIRSGSMLGRGASPHAAFVSYSPKHSPGSQFAAGANSHRAPTYHPGMSAASPGLTEMSVESRRRKKKMNSEAKLRRMSMSIQHQLRAEQQRQNPSHLSAIAEGSPNDSSFAFSPFPKAKCPSATKKILARRGSAMFNRHNTSDLIAEPSFASHHSGTDCDLSFGNGSMVADSSLGHGDGHLFRPTSVLNELNFKGIVVGGVYQHCFDNAFPVVAAPTGSDKRIVDVVIQDDNALVLSLYLPREKTTKTIDLGTKWMWMRCSPTGYLAFRSAVVPDERNVCYFLPKHPDDWKSQAQAPVPIAAAPNARMSILGGGRGRRMSIVPQHEFNPRPRQSPTVRLHKGIEMDCQALEEITRCEGLEQDGLVAVEGDEEGEVYDTFKMHSDEDLDLSLNQPDPEVDVLDLASLDVKETVAAQSEHWSNPHLLSLVFDFLVNDADLLPNSTTSQAKVAAEPPPRRRSQRKETATPAPVEPAPSTPKLLQCQLVNKTWALAAYMVIARRKSTLALAARNSFDFARYQTFATKFQSGMYLSEGVCKNVYCVFNPSSQSLEALSVMDIDDLRERDMTLAVTQEIHISLLCSAMVTLKICPNLVVVNSLFQADFNAPMQLWGEKRGFNELRTAPRRANVGLRKGQLQAGSFQYIRSEFCSGGDVEERLRGIGRPPDLPTVRMMIFQMFFSLYACREKLCLRHFDVKLLNFFVTAPDILHTGPSGATPASVPAVTHLQIGVDQHVYSLPMQSGTLSLIKLADFGTSAVGAHGVGDPITIQQFTTLENTPPEFLLLGSAARQSYAADTFPLGLCFFHLLTGYAPYEELLADVHCPAHLAAQLRRIWLTDQATSPFYIIHDVVKTLDMESTEGEPEDVLLDTLYRYMVLFGLNTEFSMDEAPRSAYCDSPVWKVLFDALDLRGVHMRLADKELGKVPKFPTKAAKKAQGNTAKAECAAQYLRDVQLWSVVIGNHPTMMSFRERLDALGNGAYELLESLLHFDPARRCTMYDAMQHPLFECLRLGPQQAAIAATGLASAQLPGVVRYMHYYRGARGGAAGHSTQPHAVAVDALPIL